MAYFYNETFFCKIQRSSSWKARFPQFLNVFQGQGVPNHIAWCFAISLVLILLLKCPFHIGQCGKFHVDLKGVVKCSLRKNEESLGKILSKSSESRRNLLMGSSGVLRFLWSIGPQYILFLLSPLHFFSSSGLGFLRCKSSAGSGESLGFYHFAHPLLNHGVLNGSRKPVFQL